MRDGEITRRLGEKPANRRQITQGYQTRYSLRAKNDHNLKRNKNTPTPQPNTFFLRSPLRQRERRAYRSCSEGCIPSRHHRSILRRGWGASWAQHAGGGVATGVSSVSSLTLGNGVRTHIYVAHVKVSLMNRGDSIGPDGLTGRVFFQRSSWRCIKKQPTAAAKKNPNRQHGIHFMRKTFEAPE